MTTRKIKYGTKELIKEMGELTFGQMLKSHRLSEEMSQKNFSKKLGISPSSLCDLEKGRKIPSINRAIRIAKKLKISEKFLVQLVIQDLLRREDLEYAVKLEKAS